METNNNVDVVLLNSKIQIADQPKYQEKETLKKRLKKNLLAVLTVLAIVLGFVIGLTVRLTGPSKDTILWLGFPGKMFLNLLRMPIIPLIISSIITASASLSPKSNGKIGVILLSYNVITNFVSTGMGIALTLLIKPGTHETQNNNIKKSVSSSLTTADLATDLIRNLIPSNLVGATFQKESTVYREVVVPVEEINGTSNATDLVTLERTTEFVDSTNLIGLIFCSVIFGLATAKAGEKGKPFLTFFQSSLDIILIVVGWCLWTAPVGIISLTAASLADIDDLWSAFVMLGLFVLCIGSGIAIHQLIFIPLLHLIFIRKNPLRMYLVSIKAWCMTFASASATSAMPYMYLACSELGIAEKVSSLCIPMSVALNSNGSGLFIASALLFLAQVNSIALTISQIITILVLVSLSMMALPSVPSASLVVLVILSSIFGIPTESVGILFAVEWILDRIRTTSNFMGGMFCIVLVWKKVKNDFNNPKDLEYDLEHTIIVESSDNMTVLI